MEYLVMKLAAPGIGLVGTEPPQSNSALEDFSTMRKLMRVTGPKTFPVSCLIAYQFPNKMNYYL